MALLRERAGSRHDCLTALLLALVLWLGLALVPGAPRAFAQSQCTAPANACGCASCGCGSAVAPRCPEGQTPYDDYCLPACPEGWLRYPGFPGLCTPPCEHGCPEGYEQVPLPSCPDGYHRDLQNIDQCAPDFAPGQDDCPPGMVLSPNTLQCVTDCPAGTYRDARGLCRSYYQDPCPAGFGRDPETGQCVPPGTWQPGYQWICLPVCPPGTQRDIYHPTRCIPPPPQCPPGFETWHGRCLPPCDQGRERDPYGYCAPRCPDGSFPNLRGRRAPPPCPPGFDNVQGQCVPPCDQGLTRDENGRCGPPDEGCPQGYDTFRGQCVPPCPGNSSRDRQTGICVPPDTGCPQGQEKYHGQCVPLCEPGQQRDARGRCINPGCPSGTENVQGRCLPLCRKDLVRRGDGSCGCPQGSDQVNGRCLPACDPGEVRDGTGRCVQPGCPKGQESFAGRCVPMCFAGTVRDSRGRCVCPRGTQMSAAGRCEQAGSEQPCGPGSHADDSGNCVPDRHIQSQCPDGWHYNRKRLTCVPDRQNDQPTQRQPNLQLDPNALQQLLPRTKNNGNDGGNLQQSCPKGFMPDGKGGCVRG